MLTIPLPPNSTALATQTGRALSGWRRQDWNSREIIKRLKQDGWLLHHVRGDHYQFKHPQKPGKVTVPHPKKDFPVGTLRSIYQQARWEWR